MSLFTVCVEMSNTYRSVTRLIKASKNQKPTRDSLLATSGSTSSLSFGKSEVQLSSKLAAAQSELQACEAHLASKERQLDLMRTQAVRTGLQARCKALVECGWQWGEMGKEGLRALETLEIPNGLNGHGEFLILMRERRRSHSSHSLSARPTSIQQTSSRQRTV